MIILFQPHIKTGCAEIWVEPYKEIMKKDGTDADSMSDSDVFKLYPLPQKLDFRMHE